MSKPTTAKWSTNLAGIVSILSNASMCDWVIDTGTTHHVIYCKGILNNIKKAADQWRHGVQLSIGNKSQITHTGEAFILGVRQ